MADKDVDKAEKTKLKNEIIDEISGLISGQPASKQIGRTPTDRLKNALNSFGAQNVDRVCEQVASRLEIDETRTRTLDEIFANRTGEFAARQEKQIDDQVRMLDEKRKEGWWKNLAATVGILGFGVAGAATFAWQSLERSAIDAAEIAAENKTDEFIQDFDNASALTEQARTNALAALKTATEAQTQAKINLSDTEASLKAANSLLADIKASEGLIDTIRDAEDAFGLVKTALSEEETLDLFEDRLQKYVMSPRAIVAFPDTGARDCPVGWDLFKPAIGRMIVGAGDPIANSPSEGLTERLVWKNDNSADNPKTFGGAETVTLEERHMPEHSHQVSNTNNLRLSTHKISPESDADLRVVQFENGFGHDNQELEAQNKGGGQPHQNMPPWIALYFCVKE